MSVSDQLEALIRSLTPGARVVEVRPLAPDAGVAPGDGTSKAAGYGAPQRVRVRGPDGGETWLVFRTVTANDFGHDRRADRAGETLLAFDTFPRIPRHVQAVDVGGILADGRLVSLRDAGELYLLTTYAPGLPYAEELRRIARTGEAGEQELARCKALAQYLVELHAAPGSREPEYVRSVRDLVGSAQGIFGIIDGYPPDVPAAPPARLEAIERRCASWRWKLRGQGSRLVRTHGDFHPFNVIFDEGLHFTLLDASRGCEGDRADDVTCMAINFVFFALDHPASWARGLGLLWRRFWRTYLEGAGDAALLDVSPPYLAWRGLVLANPAFYPSLTPGARDRILGLVERALEAGHFDPAWAEELFP